MFDSKSLVYYHRVDMVDGEIMICPMNTNMQLFQIPNLHAKDPGTSFEMSEISPAKISWIRILNPFRCHIAQKNHRPFPVSKRARAKDQIFSHEIHATQDGNTLSPKVLGYDNLNVVNVKVPGGVFSIIYIYIYRKHYIETILF